ncbi:hypothetical protein RM572_14995 [Streptomyces sp. DSM 42041]|uniref:WXG100 family type VII secretion target n=1 Tax=Streptomyces hazeniae TaxID=3075538 RepID=A0ABU2NSV6_9ACTN|nr:hypothetical protein [Streptomyces sp. DSM 42041]MDT0380067.1 hypothetical protein [Streptomyces sp. DSM 42041]
MSGGYTFDPEAAKQVEQGLRAATAELEETGYFSIAAQQGHGFQSLSMSGMELGSHELADVFGQFCDRWSAAVHGNMQGLNSIAVKLGLSAGLYHEQEQYVNDTLKEVAVTAGSYDPSQGLAEGGDAADKSWDEVRESIGSGAAEPDLAEPDWDGMGDQWEQVGEDFSTSPWQDVAGPGRWDDSDWQWDGPPPEPEGRQQDGQDQNDGGK